MSNGMVFMSLNIVQEHEEKSISLRYLEMKASLSSINNKKSLSKVQWCVQVIVKYNEPTQSAER